MKANQLAEMLECLGWRSVDANLREAAEMLRKQAEAIKVLREALVAVSDGDIYLPPITRSIVLDALKNTEEFQ